MVVMGTDCGGGGVDGDSVVGALGGYLCIEL